MFTCYALHSCLITKSNDNIKSFDIHTFKHSLKSILLTHGCKLRSPKHKQRISWALSMRPELDQNLGLLCRPWPENVNIAQFCIWAWYEIRFKMQISWGIAIDTSYQWCIIHVQIIPNFVGKSAVRRMMLFLPQNSRLIYGTAETMQTNGVSKRLGNTSEWVMFKNIKGYG